MAHEQRPHRAVAHDRHVAVGAVEWCAEDIAHGIHDALLCINGTFPAARRPLRMGKESIGEQLMAFRFDEARGRTVDFSCRPTHVQVQIQPGGDQICRLEGFRFGATDDETDRADPFLVEQGVDPVTPELTQPPLGDRSVWVDVHVGMADVSQNRHRHILATTAGGDRKFAGSAAIDFIRLPTDTRQ